MSDHATDMVVAFTTGIIIGAAIMIGVMPEPAVKSCKSHVCVADDVPECASAMKTLTTLGSCKPGQKTGDDE